jgi:predicted RNase H-like HicB family nuclease
MTRYIAVIDGKEGAYGVTIPDLPGCFSGGDTIEDALRNAIEAIRMWIEAANEDSTPVPHPRKIEEIRNDPNVKELLGEGGVFASVPVVMESGRPAKANISLDSGLLKALDEAAEARGLTRSAFIASAVQDKIAAG